MNDETRKTKPATEYQREIRCPSTIVFWDVMTRATGLQTLHTIARYVSRSTRSLSKKKANNGIILPKARTKLLTSPAKMRIMKAI